MLLLVAIALIGAVTSEPQGIIPMGYDSVAPNVAPSVFPVPYSTIPTASLPSPITGVFPAPMSASIPAVIPAPMSASIPAVIPAPMPASIPALIPASISGPIPAESIPAPAFPLGSYPAGTIPLASIPAAALPAATIPAAPGVIQMAPNIVYPSLDINMVRSPVNPKPTEDTPEVKKARMDFEMAYNKAQSGTPETASVFRARRDIQRVLPYGYNLPYSGYVTPYGHVSGAVPSSHVLPSNVLHAPYFAHV